MPDAVLIVTFSPVQSFIAEARRAADLFTGSHILVELARAAAQSVRDAGGNLIFPATLTDDAPNKLVALVPWEQARAIAEQAEAALRARWATIATDARATLTDRRMPPVDANWTETWERQTGGLWEVYWSAAWREGVDDEGYRIAYRTASRGLDAAKRTRAFGPAEEPGMKDTFSGRRAALRTRADDARTYWTAVSATPGVTAAMLRPDGRERLDAIGAVKRFSKIADERFPSTSTVATRTFRATATEAAPNEVAGYRRAIEALLPGPPRVQDEPWPYDGDLLFAEMLTVAALRDRYRLPDGVPEQALRPARDALRTLHRRAGTPSPYYAIIALDGDEMGKHVDQALTQPDPIAAHRGLSASLAAFAGTVRALAADSQATIIYNGGDDVLLLAPLRTAIGLARSLAQQFTEKTGGTASAGVAIAHHLTPLDTALVAAREAEQRAKRHYGRSALCVRALKRSGESVETGSGWEAMGGLVDELVGLFTSVGGAETPLSSRLAYDVSSVAPILPEPGDQFRSELGRLIARHRNRTHAQGPDPDRLATRLCDWAKGLPAGEQSETLARWLILARFIAQGGGE
jgi:CRISPR-associated protein Cmr2